MKLTKLLYIYLDIYNAEAVLESGTVTECLRPVVTFIFM